MATWPVKAYSSQHTTWPYQPSDFAREDPSADTSFYTAPRFVTHIDDSAISRLRKYYAEVLPRRGRLLDLCSSWISHYPDEVTKAAERGELQVTGMGMNHDELDANEVLNNGRILVDLNAGEGVEMGDGKRKARVPDLEQILLQKKSIGANEADKLDATTCVVSIDYLTRPVAVLADLRAATKIGGAVHLAISNRCFPTKAIRRWLRVDEEERLTLVGDFLHFAGWRRIEIVNLCRVDGDGSTEEPQHRLGALMTMMGMHPSRDPLWVVRGVKE